MASDGNRLLHGKARPLSLLFVLLSACAAPTRIDSRPDGARCYVEGSMVGYTPVELHLSSAHHDIRLERDGYVTVRARLHRRFDSKSLGLIPVFPLLLFPRFSTRLERAYLIELQLGEGDSDIGVVEGVDSERDAGE